MQPPLAKGVLNTFMGEMPNVESPAVTAETRHIKYAFVDIVRFSTGRSVEAQNDIVDTLNAACKVACRSIIPNGEVIYVPTGDGICVAIIEGRARYDAHLLFAQSMLEQLALHNTSADNMRQFEVRIGLSENVDSIVQDINGNRNVAGMGVTLAQRIMSLADGGQVLLSRAVYETLHVRERYMNSFVHFTAVIKHGARLDVYQFVESNQKGLDNGVPDIFRHREPIEDRLDTCLGESPSTADQMRCIRQAIEGWEAEIDNRLFELSAQLDDAQRELLSKTQKAWVRYKNAELRFGEAFYSKMRGTMWRPIRADLPHALLKERGGSLGAYRDSVSEQFDPSQGQSGD
ncbi:MAG TPA: lysozyme inhibitor LprI family protein [Chthoniobacterales bacterium]|nr:lysozyme inhibitor LprI family protein [Chthoniobacterales bacterium]